MMEEFKPNLNKRTLFPIGSVVLLKEGNVPIMIYGRKQIALEDHKQWDYAAVPYPEGHSDNEHTYLFNHDMIETLLFIGYQTEKEERLSRFIYDMEQGRNDGTWSGE